MQHDPNPHKPDDPGAPKPQPFEGTPPSGDPPPPPKKPPEDDEPLG